MSDVSGSKKSRSSKGNPRSIDSRDKKRKKEEDLKKFLQKKEQERIRLTEEETEYMKREEREQSIRLKKLNRNCHQFHEFRRLFYEYQLNVRAKSDWRSVVNCQDHRITPWVNEFVSFWLEEEEDTVEIISKRCEIASLALEITRNFSENPEPGTKAEHLLESGRRLRDATLLKLDRLSYKILRNVENMIRSELDVCYFENFTPQYSLYLWTILKKPRSRSCEKFGRKVHFQEVSVQFPKDFCFLPFVTRILRMKLADFLTPFSEIRGSSEKEDLIKFSIKLWERKEQTWRQKREEEAAVSVDQERKNKLLSKMKHLLPGVSKDTTTATDYSISMDRTSDATTTDSKDVEETDIFAVKTLSQRLAELEAADVETEKAAMKTNLEMYQVNTRKYIVLGDVYILDLFRQPGQPILLKDGFTLTVHRGDSLQPWDYLEILQKTKQSGSSSKSTDEAGEEDSAETNIISVSLKQSSQVFWFDNPTPVRWDSEKDYWSTEFVYEARYNEEKLTSSFRLGKMSPVALCTLRYANLPYQMWEIKRVQDNVIISVTASTATVEFTIIGGEVCLSQLQNVGSEDVLRDVLGVYQSPWNLIKTMKSRGLDLFPEEDAFLYVEGVSAKDSVTERHLYSCMAALCLLYDFSWSRWNAQAGYRKFAVEMRQTDGEKHVVLVSPERAIVVECSDFNLDDKKYPGTGNNFYPDLLTLLQSSKSESDNRCAEMTDPVLAGTVQFMLSEIKPLRFS